jgi:hypothetical protein
MHLENTKPTRTVGRSARLRILKMDRKVYAASILRDRHQKRLANMRIFRFDSLIRYQSSAPKNARAVG